MKTIAGAALLTLVALPAQAEGKNATFEYTLTDLGTLSSSSRNGCGPAELTVGGGNSNVNSISDNGEAVGFYCFRTATDQVGIYHGFRWTAHHGMVDLGFPKGWTDPRTLCQPIWGQQQRGDRWTIKGS